MTLIGSHIPLVARSKFHIITNIHATTLYKQNNTPNPTYKQVSYQLITLNTGVT